jgi:hypothetical protein
MTSHISAEQSQDSLPLSWQRLLALSGVVFALLFAGSLVSSATSMTGMTRT